MGESNPVAQPPYRVPRSRVDERFNRSSPLPNVKVGAGEVVSVSADGETMTVRLGGEEIAGRAARAGDEEGEEVSGVVALGCPPDPGDWVEVQSRGGLLVSPEASSDWWTTDDIGGFGGDTGSGITIGGNVMVAYRYGAGWQTRPSVVPPPDLVVIWVGTAPAPTVGGSEAMTGDLYFQTATPA